MEPDFDEDDLINDYIEDSFEPPAEYDDDYLEQMMAAEEPPPPQPQPPPTDDRPQTEQVMTTNVSIDDLMSDDDDAGSEASSVRVEYNRSRSTSRVMVDTFAFERYKTDASWRMDKSSSPSKDTMKATGWKREGQKTRNNLSIVSGLSKSQSPATQLLDFLNQDTQKPAKLYRSRMKANERSRAAEKSVPMTFGDGTRLFIRVREPSLSTKVSNARSRYALGVSMEELMRRVNAIRRNNERERLQKEADDDEDMEEEAPEDSDSPSHSYLWVDKHAPSSFAHLLSDDRTNREVVRALRAWDPYVFHRDPPARPEFMRMKAEMEQTNQNDSAGEKKKKSKDRRPEESARVILLSGPPGVGKTTLAHIVARHAGYRPLEVNGSDERSASVLTECVVRAMESNTLDMSGGEDGAKPNCIILDEIDGADAKGAIKALVDIIRAEIPARGAKGKAKVPYLRRPIVFICNNKYAPTLRPLLPFAKQFNVSPPSTNRLVSRLRSVLNDEGMQVSGGSSALNQLVTLSGGDIRSCLHTLQFVSTRAKRMAAEERVSLTGKAKHVDVSQALLSALNGDGMKDGRNDIAAAITSVFRRTKRQKMNDVHLGIAIDARPNSARVLEAVQGFGEASRILDGVFVNLLRVSYIDPTLDRCAAAHEWLSSSDLYRSFKTSVASNNASAMNVIEAYHIPPAAAAIHLLCRVEQRMDLTFTMRELTDIRFQTEDNEMLLHKFAEGWSTHVRGSRSVALLATDVVPYTLWALSAGEGNVSLNRPASSFELLNQRELSAFVGHAHLLKGLGLTYVVAYDGPENDKRVNHRAAAVMRLEPPVDRLVNFVDLNVGALSRKEIAPAMKELLAQRVAQERHCIAASSVENGSTKTPQVQDENMAEASMDTAPAEMGESLTAKSTSPTTKRDREPEMQTSQTKRSKSSLTAQNFLGIGAKKAKEARSARSAARVGFTRSKKNKCSHSGSGIPLQQVVRLKYVKGFTQAVRTPCRLEDIA